MMDRTRITANRVRPILQAMERSIDSARRRRTTIDTPQSAAPAPRPTFSAPSPLPSQLPTRQPTSSYSSTPSPQPPSSSTPGLSSDNPPRLKAKPKRFDGPSPEASHRRQAG